MFKNNRAWLNDTTGNQQGLSVRKANKVCNYLYPWSVRNMNENISLPSKRVDSAGIAVCYLPPNVKYGSISWTSANDTLWTLYQTTQSPFSAMRKVIYHLPKDKTKRNQILKACKQIENWGQRKSPMNPNANNFRKLINWCRSQTIPNTGRYSASYFRICIPTYTLGTFCLRICSRGMSKVAKNAQGKPVHKDTSFLQLNYYLL